MGDLPEYEGVLKPSPGLSIALTQANLKSLEEAADPLCELCRGAGFTGWDLPEICPCTRRDPPPEAA